ncbi:TRAFAC clade GTPase domain-containing protein [Streptomyces phaeofaciens]|uniref:TRAFAC clade GTPase domain-containing protein n=1 Tax=Streptomyces phaeofaciens TaxID=68254 RepID=UPI00368F5C23
MNIVMLGHSNAGKTTYIAMMYALMRKGYGGFKVRAEDGALDRELRAAADAVRQGSYPPPSSRREQHVFRLSHGRRTVAGFTWTDYRGGALSSRTDDEETARVLAELTGADGIVVFVDAHHLAHGDRGGREVRRLTVLLQRAMEGRTSRIPVVLAYTKADLLTSTDAWARATAPLDLLQQSLDGASMVRAATVALSCGPQPAGVQVPVLWCLAQHLSIRVEDLEHELAVSRRLAEEAKNKAGLWNSLVSTLDGVESEYRKWQRHEQAAKEEAAQLAPLKRPAKRLLAALDKAREQTAPPVPAGR